MEKVLEEILNLKIMDEKDYEKSKAFRGMNTSNFDKGWNQSFIS
jgi:hypothetical protein